MEDTRDTSIPKVAFGYWPEWDYGFCCDFDDEFLIKMESRSISMSPIAARAFGKWLVARSEEWMSLKQPARSTEQSYLEVLVNHS